MENGRREGGHGVSEWLDSLRDERVERSLLYEPGQYVSHACRGGLGGGEVLPGESSKLIENRATAAARVPPFEGELLLVQADVVPGSGSGVAELRERSGASLERLELAGGR